MKIIRFRDGVLVGGMVELSFSTVGDLLRFLPPVADKTWWHVHIFPEEGKVVIYFSESAVAKESELWEYGVNCASEIKIIHYQGFTRDLVTYKKETLLEFFIKLHV